jgi:hypothetical protein
MNLLKKVDWLERGFQIAADLNALAVLVILSVYGYGGLFSRYRADDYCESANMAHYQNIVEAIIQSYNSWLNSYSTLVFVKFTDLGGLWGLRLWPGLIILLWGLALVWLLSELEKTTGVMLGWGVKLWVSGLMIFLSLYQTKVLFQILYWRPVSIPYTFPLVFFIGIAAFLLWYARQPYQKARALWVGTLGFGFVLFAGGLGETDAAFQFGLLVVAVFAVWVALSAHRRRDMLMILLVLLAGAVVSLLIMLASPGTTNRLDVIMNNPPIYNPVKLALKVTDKRNNGIQISSSRIGWISICLLLFVFFVIGCSFAPSAFVRTFPTAHARFPAYFMVVFGLISFGGLMGMLLGEFRFPLPLNLTRSLMVGILAVLAIYPFQASRRIYASLTPYRNFAAAWDVRDVQIRSSVAQGARDLVVVQLDSVADVPEYKGFGSPGYWINVCAAQYYGLHTLVAP